MIREIFIYIEGGGDHKVTKSQFRQGFGEFLDDLREQARARGIRWQIVACGGRSLAYDYYQRAVKSHPEAFNVLLVDAEGPVTGNGPWDHLKRREGDQWDNPGVEEKHCHLMVQTMEAWLIADRDKLKQYYGRGFSENALPNNPDVEQIEKDSLARALDAATRRTQKGIYHKTRHAPQILERIRPSEVRSKAPFCDRLFTTLLAEIAAP